MAISPPRPSESARSSDHHPDCRPTKRIKRDAATENALDDADDDEATTATSSVARHPLGVRPSGNAFTSEVNLKAAMGTFALLPDELLASFLEILQPADLLRLGGTCRAWHAFTRNEELWRALFVESPPKDFTWRGTWRSTYLSQPSTAEPVVDCSCLFSDVLHRPFYCAHVDLTPYTTKIPSANRIARLPDLTYTEFAESWVTKPFILTEPVKQWPIYRTWDLDFLREKYSDVAFRAEAVDWPLRTYLEYMSACDGDESPLYLFDRAFAEKMQLTVGDNSSSSSATDPTPDYTPPTCFGPDAFTHLGSSRPDHRWLIIGPARSGSTFHQDPNATSAWNAVLRGKKYWILFPPSSSSAQRPPPPGVYVSEDRSEVTSPLSIAEWFLEFHAAARATPGCVEGICEAGEVVYVPSGWFHLVLNLEESIAVTQNLVPRKRVGAVLRFLKEQRQSVSGFREEIEDPFGLWVERLREADPELAEEGLAEMERLGRIGGRWEELTKGAKKGDGEEEEEGEGGGFSFGFGFGGDEGEEEQA